MLQFGNGVAPRAGDAFDVLDVAGELAGEFAEVAIQGLVPGSYGFEPSLAGGKRALTSLTDAEARPTVSVKAKKRVKESAKGGKFKLKRTGDTSAPLLVSYNRRRDRPAPGGLRGAPSVSLIVRLKRASAARCPPESA